MTYQKVNRCTTVKNNRKIAVIGASGHTGRFVVSELARRGIKGILVGRDAVKLSQMASEHPSWAIQVASVDSPQTLDQALAEMSLVINCAGPFIDTAVPVMDAALRAGIHYLDVTAEQRVTLEAFERFSAAAKAAGVVIMPSIAFYGGLGDLLATAVMADWTTADEIHLAVALDSWKPTLGTSRTGERNPGRRFVFSRNVLTLVDEPPSELSWNFPPPFGEQDVVPFPLAETIVISRHLRVPEIHAYVNRTALNDLHDPATSPPLATDESGRSDQRFYMEVLIRKGDEERRAAVAGRDIYAVTAALVAEAAERILTADCRRSGVLTPGEIFDPRAFLRALSPEPFSLSIGEDVSTMSRST